MLISEKISSILARLNGKNEQDIVKKIFGRIRWKRIVAEGVKLRVETWMGGNHKNKRIQKA